MSLTTYTTMTPDTPADELAAFCTREKVRLETWRDASAPLSFSADSGGGTEYVLTMPPGCDPARVLAWVREAVHNSRSWDKAFAVYELLEEAGEGNAKVAALARAWIGAMQSDKVFHPLLDEIASILNGAGR